MKTKLLLLNVSLLALALPSFAQTLIYAPTDVSSSGNNHYGLKITPSLNQTSTAGFTDLFIDRTETAVGSGSQLLIDAQNGGSTRFNVTNTGSVAMNGPSGTPPNLSIVDNGANNSGHAPSIYMYGHSIGGNLGAGVAFFNNGSVQASINCTANGACVISSAGGYAVIAQSNQTLTFPGYGAGTLTTDASGNVTTTSDARLKNLLGSFTRGLAEVEHLHPLRYSWRSGSGNETEGVYAGFTAQDVQASIPEAVGRMKNGMLTLQDRPIEAALVNAAKTLAARVNIAYGVAAFALGYCCFLHRRLAKLSVSALR